MTQKNHNKSCLGYLLSRLTRFNLASIICKHNHNDMSLNSPFVKHALDALNEVAPITFRRIFNGIGIYHKGVQFAIILQDQLFFRASEDSRCLFEAQRMPSFQPRGADLVESFFYQLPDDLLDKPDELKYWMRIAVEAAHQGEFLDDETSFVVRYTKQG